MATGETITLNAAHAPSERAILAFEKVEDDIKTAILESRKDWDRHEPRMWKTASQTSDEDLVNFNIKDDLVVVRSAVTSYGPIILGKIRIRAIKLDASGELVPGPVEKNADGSIKVEMNHGKVNDELYGYMFVRIHDPLGEGMDNIKFHSLFTDEGKDVEGNQNGKYCAIQHNSKPLEFFHERHHGLTETSTMFVDPSRVLANALAVSSAEAASLGGRKAKTPMLAGAIIGSIMGAAYVVGFTIYFYKRCRRKKLKRLVENGQAPPEVLERKKDGEEEEREQERVVIPPDPAVLLGEYKAGDVVVVDEKKHRRHPSYHRAKSSPGNGVHRDGEAGGSTSALVRTDTEDMAGRPSEASTPVTPHPNVPT